MKRLRKKREKVIRTRNIILLVLGILSFVFYEEPAFLWVCVGLCIATFIWYANSMLRIDKLVYKDLKFFLQKNVDIQEELRIFSTCMVEHWVEEYKRNHFNYPFVLNILFDKEHSKLYQDMLKSTLCHMGTYQMTLWQINNLDYRTIAKKIETHDDTAWLFLEYLSIEDLSYVLNHVDHLLVDFHMMLSLGRRKDQEISTFFFLCIQKQKPLIPNVTKDVLFKAELPFEILGYLVKYEACTLDAFLGIEFKNLRKEIFSLWASLPEKEDTLFIHWPACNQEEIDILGKQLNP